MREAYLTPAARANVPLLRADDQFLAYRKGPFAMYALREYIGGEHVDGALRRLLDRAQARDDLRLPTLARSLSRASGDHAGVAPGLLADLFETNTFWELATERH